MSTLGKNLIKAPDVASAAKPACSQAGNAVSDAADKVGDGIGAVTSLFGGGDAGKKANDAIDGAGDKAGGATSDACNKGAEIANDAVQLTADVINKALGSVAKAIGIKEYYSVHIGALCEGNYDPLFSDPKAKPKVQKCSRKFHAEQTDLSKKLDDELQVGPFKFKLSDLDLVEGIQKAFDLIPRALAAMAYFFLFAVLGLVLGMLLAAGRVVCEYVMQRMQKVVLLAAMGSMGFGWAASLIGAIGVTAVAEKVKKEVNKNGDKFGMSAATSPALYFLLWGSLVFSTVALALLVFVWLKTRGGRGMGMGGVGQYAKNRSESSGMEDSHGFARMPTSGGGEFREQPL